MDANLKQKWVEALRSGEYEQTSGSLIEEGSEGKRAFCCLGVLCEAIGAQWVDISTETGLLGDFYVRSPHGSYLSAPMLDHVGLTDQIQRELAEMNDNGAPFAQLAAHIEENL